MSCSSVDLKAYFLGEAARSEKSAVEDHLRACPACSEELDRLKLTESALRSLEEEEIPQRIAFVSDKVFEPRWYQTIWRSGPVMGFASAALLAAAILVHGFTRPAVTQTVDTAQIEQRVEHEVSARLDSAIAKAVSQTEAKQTQHTAELLDAAEKRFEAKRREDLAMVEDAERIYKSEYSRLVMAVNDQRAGQ
jgi:anti-sigma factor RsiW